MNIDPSDVGNRNSATSVFSNSDEPELNSSFCFRTPPLSQRLGSEKPVFGPSSSLSKPRLQKLKKHTTSQYPNPTRFMPDREGINPFGPASANIGQLLSAGPERSAPEFMFGAPGSDSHLKVDSNLGKQLVDDMRKLRFSNAEGGVSSSKTATARDFKFSVTDKTKFSCGSGENVDKSFETELPNELQRLNLRGSSARGSDNFDFNRGEFMFGSRQEDTDSISQSLGDTLSNRLRNLRVTPKSNNDGQTDNMLSLEMDKLGIKREAETSSSQRLGKETQNVNLGDVKFADLGKSIPEGVSINAGILGRDKKCSQVPIGQPNNVTKLNGAANSTAVHFRPVINVFGKQDGLGTPRTEFKTPSVKTSGSDHPLEFSAKVEANKNNRTKKRRGKKQSNPVWSSAVQMQSGVGFVPMENNSPPNFESTESYSPMDVSPYQETLAETQSSRETSVTSEGSLHFCNDDASVDACPVVSDDAIDEDLVSAAQRLGIDDAAECTYSDTNEKSSEYRSAKDASTEGTLDQSFSGAESESFITANEQLDTDSDTASTSADADSGCSSQTKRQVSDGRGQFSFASTSQDRGISNFTFAASTSIQGQLPTATRQQHKKKNRKVGYGLYNSTPDASEPYASSSAQFISLSRASSFLSRSKADMAASQCMGEKNHEVSESQYIMQDSASASVAAQEACEKWRLRGNQAYASGDFSKAEDFYTQGISCVSQNETSKLSLRALMLCYSNRAAARMSLGRVREALGDCMLAAAIDPNFLRAQLRAAQCCLALGEDEDATGYFKKILHLGSNVCVDRKIAVEASDGLQKAEKLSNCIIHSAELLQHGTSDDAQTALGVIADALSVSFYSEKLLEMKAKAFFMLQKYEEAIQLCKQTLNSAEKNSLMMDGKSASMGSFEFPRSSCRLWRLSISFKSYFYLGKLEEALEMVEKQGSGNESKALESAIPIVVTVRELLRHKALGNEAFQSGRHTEAIEHYSAALSCNVESRPFAAICFCNRAAAYKALGQITDAIADCSLAIAFDGNYLKAISRRATLFEMIRDYDQAFNDLQRLLSLLSNQVEATVNHSGASEKLASSANDLREVELHLSTIEEEARKDIPLDMYLILGIEPSTSAAEIRKAYRKAALKHHPDKAGQYLSRCESRDDEVWKKIAEEAYKDADRLFKMIGEAYAMMSDPAKRSQYDLEEEVRNTVSKGSGITSQRKHTDVPSYHFDRSSSRRHWQEIRKSYKNAHSRGPQASRSDRYY